MARKPRIQFAGALYHVINRGNYRRDVFESAATAAAFEHCLFEACDQAGWRLHAFTLMRNHFHLALETPRANLVEGMHWLQSTFATRFNRFRNERGHLFQGRYQAILVQPGTHLAQVVNYIHLNPVRAGIVTVDQLAQFRWSSFRRFVKAGRPAFLVCDDWLEAVGGIADTAEGWQRYREYLAWLAADEGEQKRQGFETLSRGWAIGDEGWRKEVAKEHAESLAAQEPSGVEMNELKEAVWTRALERLLEKAGRTRAEAPNDWCGAEWKVKIAIELRRTTTATNDWIAQELSMGTTGGSVSVFVSRWWATRSKK
ncbi:MAG: transposase [Opitutus sp.]|nr:transposase [Opitutus sp.]